MQENGSRAGAGKSGPSVQGVNSDVSDQTWRAVGAVLTVDECWALGSVLKDFALLSTAGAAMSSRDKLATSALQKLLDMPTGLTCCYHERAAIVKLLHEQLLDETPTNIDPNPAGAIRDAGYRGGWNDRARSLVRELLK